MSTTPMHHQLMHATLAVLLALASSVTQASPIVTTRDGTVQGNTENGVNQFLGLPFAAPPVGELRWRPPQPPIAWQGVRGATTLGHACPQLPGAYSQRTTDEDCLTLNVYAPEAPQSTPRPVLIWVHPGSLTMGSGGDYDGKALARQANVVVVTINYRLGALGFLSTPEMRQEGSTPNQGLQDQQQALRWVKDNIAAFGGDARNVTLAGNSSGSASICGHLASPASGGLFHRAILQSGPCVLLRTRTLDQAYHQGNAFAEKLNCPSGATQMSCLRSRSTQELITAAGDGLDILQTANPWSAVIDGATIPRNLTDMIRDGAFHKVPVLLGTTADEGRFFVSYTFHQKLGRAMTPIDHKSASDVLTGSAFAGSTARLLYPASGYPNIDLAMSALMTDSGFACPALSDARRLSRHTPVYTYEFADTQAPAPTDPFFKLGAYHTAELQYLFGQPVFATQINGAPSAEQKRLADQMVAYWSAFAKHGDPNQSGLPKWVKFNELTSPIMNLAPGKVGMQPWGEFSKTHRCVTWLLLFSLSGQN
ncbi:para-nitrobenzyl esterase [Aquabacterium commune]|jgi:para-nitrobenzyl esterase|uniref:Carboxylic ester hydrolase n=1 Tax=Aquabacterium commune TaxID=70586 RepID=A0A4R6R813_9BURK|nr:carboxylesterase/lipase family protein [Aquabacterium commune]TDP82133.1 para-nitrobenzyl esterase [Aquabacterium commune]|tara:strand:+ start:2767 stop:4377 length:1611 start_codon:yes stop_codon:yes gene_type:complete